ncbi:hypothetical protein [Clostridium sp.]|jgi:hypothetical protein|uniref:hypothetical protein n=1 Tax=Clostridium sp. TaxID=1506 RepID=UPI003EEAAA7A
MNKRSKKLLSMLLISALVLSSNANVFANQNNRVDKNILKVEQIQSNKKIVIPDAQKKELIAWLTSNGVDNATQKNLLNKLYQGILWDSLTKATPVQTIELAGHSTKYIYADGSISISSMNFDGGKLNNVLLNATEIQKLSVQPTSDTVTAATTAPTGTYKNIKVAMFYGLFYASFLADFTLVRDGFDRIDALNNKSCTAIFPVDYTGLTLVMSQKTETRAHHAQGTLSVTIKTPVGSTQYNLYIYVGNDFYYKMNS